MRFIAGSVWQSFVLRGGTGEHDYVGGTLTGFNERHGGQLASRVLSIDLIF